MKTAGVNISAINYMHCGKVSYNKIYKKAGKCRSAVVCHMICIHRQARK